jgi:hypothetical protein
MKLSDIPRHEDLINKLNKPTGWVHVDDSPARKIHFITIDQLRPEELQLTIGEQYKRMLAKGFRHCRICRGWRSPDQTPAEHHAEEHTGIRLHSAEQVWDVEDDEPWTPDGPSTRDTTPIEPSQFGEPDAGARQQLETSYRNWRDYRTGQ